MDVIREEQDDNGNGYTATTHKKNKSSSSSSKAIQKDIMIHEPGGPSGLVVRAMYYTPMPTFATDVIIEVEVSVFLGMYAIVYSIWNLDYCP